MIAFPLLCILLPWSFSQLFSFLAWCAQEDLNWLPDSMDANGTWPFEERINRDEFVLEWASRGSLIFLHITHFALIFAPLYCIFLYTKSSTLLSFLKSHGYDSLTLRDAAMIYASVRNLAFTLPDAATVLVLPGYSPDPDSLIRYVRDHEAYRANPRS